MLYRVGFDTEENEIILATPGRTYDASQFPTYNTTITPDDGLDLRFFPSNSRHYLEWYVSAIPQL
jgi:hypothetical protein